MCLKVLWCNYSLNSKLAAACFLHYTVCHKATIRNYKLGSKQKMLCCMLHSLFMFTHSSRSITLKKISHFFTTSTSAISLTLLLSHASHILSPLPLHTVSVQYVHTQYTVSNKQKQMTDSVIPMQASQKLKNLRP